MIDIFIVPNSRSFTPIFSAAKPNDQLFLYVIDIGIHLRIKFTPQAVKHYLWVFCSILNSWNIKFYIYLFVDLMSSLIRTMFNFFDAMFNFVDRVSGYNSFL